MVILIFFNIFCLQAKKSLQPSCNILKITAARIHICVCSPQILSNSVWLLALVISSCPDVVVESGRPRQRRRITLSRLALTSYWPPSSCIYDIRDTGPQLYCTCHQINVRALLFYAERNGRARARTCSFQPSQCFSAVQSHRPIRRRARAGYSV